jgi:CMP-N-acetylneuraminic acid synthetase
MNDNPRRASPPRVLGVIPARGGSKRLPRKNILPLGGHPVIAYTIDAARRATTLTDWLVSSEDAEVIAVATRYGAPVPFVRPAELATDEVRNIATVRHALEFMERRHGSPYDILVLLQPTCPVRDPAHIDEAVRRLHRSDLDSAVSVKGPFKKRDPILKAVRGGVLEDYCPGPDPNDAEPFYIYNASIYAVKRDYFMAHDRLISPSQVPIFMDTCHSIDIDSAVDLLVAEAYVSHLGINPAPEE